MLKQDTYYIVIDIETYDTKPTAVIIDIGCAVVSFNGKVWIVDKTNNFSQSVNDGCADSYIRTASEDTMKWWKGHQLAHKTITESPCKTTLRNALVRLSLYIDSLRKQSKKLCIVGNSPSFDCGILKDAYEQCGIECPWQFREEFDYRTINKILPDHTVDSAIPFSVLRNPTPHTGLSDALFEAQRLCLIGNNCTVSWNKAPYTPTDVWSYWYR